MTSKTSSALYLEDDAFYDAPEGPHSIDTDPSGMGVGGGIGDEDHTGLSPEELELRRSEWRAELAKTEEEIQTLRQVLSSKLRRAHELKRRLGITALTEVREDFRHGIQAIKGSDTFQKTGAAVKAAKEKTSSTLHAAGSRFSQKLGSIRNSTTFRSFEEKVGSAYCSVKGKLSGSRSINENLASGDQDNQAHGDEEIDNAAEMGGGLPPAPASSG